MSLYKIASPNSLNQQGFVALVTVLVISAIMLTISLFMSSAAINDLLYSYASDQSERALQIADGCIDEAIFRLKKNSGYAGSTLSLNGGSCTVVVAGAGNSRTLTSTGTLGSYTRKITATVSFITNAGGNANSVDLTHWEEI
ncbi:hypothetical protein HY224_00040 [Candidatus Uhrbacteria bacterium]|nr:hypothetical protein [Candidatus Uhrbacteria bacterium]